jgi:hypothetical protein
MVADPEGRQCQDQLKHAIANVEVGPRRCQRSPHFSCRYPELSAMGCAPEPLCWPAVTHGRGKASDASNERLVCRAASREATREQPTQQRNQLPALLLRPDRNA